MSITSKFFSSLGKPCYLEGDLDALNRVSLKIVYFDRVSEWGDEPEDSFSSASSLVVDPYEGMQYYEEVTFDGSYELVSSIKFKSFEEYEETHSELVECVFDNFLINLRRKIPTLNIEPLVKFSDSEILKSKLTKLGIFPPSLF